MRLLKTLAVDLALVAIATWLAVLVRFNLEIAPEILGPTLAYIVFSLLAALVMLPAAGVTRTLWRFAGLREYARLAVASVLSAATAVGLAFLYDRLESFPRAVLPLQVLLIFVLLSLRRLVERLHRFRHAARSAPAAKGMAEPVIIVGLTSIANLFLALVAGHGNGKVAVIGLVGGQQATTDEYSGCRVLGPLPQLETILTELHANGTPVRRIVLAEPLDNLPSEARAVLHRIESDGKIRVDCFADQVGFGRRTSDPEVFR